MPKFMASAVPIILIAKSILLHSLAVWPDPTGPQWITLAPIVNSRSCAAGNISAGPPTMNVNSACLAAFTPLIIENKQ